MMKPVAFSPSILSADFSCLATDLTRIYAAGAAYAHVDVMDGHFVPNLTVGAPVVAALDRCCDIPLDVHLMISEPSRYLDDFIAAGADSITFHVEAQGDPFEIIRRIKAAGVRASVCIKPGTGVSEIEAVLPFVDMVLVMTVEPGFGGQDFMEEMLPKITELRQRLDEVNPNCDIEADGGINAINVRRVVEAGANIIVSGSYVFNDGDPEQAIDEMRKALL